MKKFAYAAMAAATLIAVPAAALQTAAPAQPRQPVTRAQVQAQVQNQFTLADANKDGFVTQAEFDTRLAFVKNERQARRGERREARFAQLDANKDGAISKAEFEARQMRSGNRAERRAERRAQRGIAGRGALAGRMGKNWFVRADADKDGRISLAEATARPLQMFVRVDANKDGTISADEGRAAFKARRDARQGKRAG
jgi:Ca2+-binding EF-hand superfamily protein